MVIHIAYNDIIIYPPRAHRRVIYMYRYDTSELHKTIYYILLIFIYGRPFDSGIYHYIIIYNNIITI